jgi:hypothetical protein
VLSAGLGEDYRPAPERAPMDWNSAIAWAVNHKVIFPPGCNDIEAERIINEAREAAGLRPWKMNEPRGNRRPFPCGRSAAA